MFLTTILIISPTVIHHTICTNIISIDIAIIHLLFPIHGASPAKLLLVKNVIPHLILSMFIHLLLLVTYHFNITTTRLL